MSAAPGSSTDRLDVVRWLDDPASDRALVGGKAAGLGRMLAAGVPVPPGFVVTTRAYEQFMTANCLWDRTDELLRGLDHHDAQQLEATTEKIRHLVLTGEVPAAIDAQVRTSYARLDTQPFVAVRSSGTAEDMAGASFAGLYDSYLHVQGPDEVLDSIRRCWASLWTTRCASYRDRLGLDHHTALVAVVVQEMVPADVAGVLFTANPLNGRTDEVVVNASWGLGEVIASGLVTPDEYVLGRGDRSVHRTTLGSKLFRLDGQGVGTGPVMRETTSEERDHYSLPGDALDRLARMADRLVELADGMPQDVEWALRDGELFILQSRDITGVEFLWDEDVEAWQDFPDEPGTTWTHVWAKMYWSGAITPLFASIRARELHNSDQRLFALWGLHELVGRRRYKYRRSTMYFSSDADRIYYRSVLPPRLRKYNLGNLPTAWHPDAASAPFSVARAVRMHARTRWLTRDQGPRRSITASYRLIDRGTKDGVGLAPAELEALSDEDLRAEISERILMFEDYMTAIRPPFHVYSLAAFAVLREMLAAWYGDVTDFAFQDLISGLPKRTLMVQEQLDLADLADVLRESPEALALLERYEGAEFFRRAGEHPSAQAFMAKYAAFRAAYAHRGHQDRDIFYARRSEDPSIDHSSLQTMVRGRVSVGSLEGNEATLVAKRLERTGDVLRVIGKRRPFGTLQARCFTFVLDYVHLFLAFRDDARFHTDKITMAKKRALQELGRRMHDRGLLPEPDDFYFLAEQELYDVLDGRDRRRQTLAKVANRRRVFEQFLARQEVPAEYLVGNVPVDVEDPSVTDESDVFQGAGTSRGSVVGRARIVRDLKEISRVVPGDILVCNSTDPGWAPLFGVISGLVLESGGMLSHGACLSREYGLPAVTLGGAMNKIEDGDRILIDGDTGRVRVHAA